MQQRAVVIGVRLLSAHQLDDKGRRAGALDRSDLAAHQQAACCERERESARRRETRFGALLLLFSRRRCRCWPLLYTVLGQRRAAPSNTKAITIATGDDHCHHQTITTTTATNTTTSTATTTTTSRERVGDKVISFAFEKRAQAERNSTPALN